MAKFNFVIKEVLKKEVTIDAETLEEAETKLAESYYNDKIVLDAVDDYAGDTTFAPLDEYGKPNDCFDNL